MNFVATHGQMIESEYIWVIILSMMVDNREWVKWKVGNNESDNKVVIENSE